MFAEVVIGEPARALQRAPRLKRNVLADLAFPYRSSPFVGDES